MQELTIETNKDHSVNFLFKNGAESLVSRFRVSAVLGSSPGVDMTG
jgi:hypothetical protein